jgi:UDP-N-acetylglucosamine 2-epimerase (non-hydrolysing)
VLTVFGVRPEAIKMAPVVLALQRDQDNFITRVAVTAQHREMLDQVLACFGIVPDYDLNIMQPQQSLTEITVRALAGLEGVLQAEQPDLVLVHGDTSTTFAAALAAFYQQVRIGHVEAGLRTGDKYAPFPEEMNRRLTGALCDLHFAPTQTAKTNLRREGVPPGQIYVTGNTAIDALFQVARPDYRFQEQTLAGLPFDRCRVILVDAHRRENLGRPMVEICRAVAALPAMAPDVRVVFSVHRNPQVNEVAHRYLAGRERIHLLAPLEYPEWANLMARAHIILTDSGGIQEEAPALGTPVLLLRETTERPEAISAGTVQLVGTDYRVITAAVQRLLTDEVAYRRMAGAVNPYGDGRAAERIVAALHYEMGLRPTRPRPFRAIVPQAAK